MNEPIDQQAQAIVAMEVARRGKPPLDLSRLRFLGGMSLPSKALGMHTDALALCIAINHYREVPPVPQELIDAHLEATA